MKNQPSLKFEDNGSITVRLPGGATAIAADLGEAEFILGRHGRQRKERGKTFSR